VFLFLADLLTLRDGACLILHRGRWRSYGVSHGGLVPDPQDWLYRSLSVTDDGLVLRSWQANPNPGAVDGYDVVPVGEPSLLPQRFDLPALWYTVDGSAFGEGDLPHLGLAH
jgi:hypothetical protein